GLELSPGLLRRPVTTVTYSRSGSSGLRMGENLKSRPVPSGVQYFSTAPCGKYTKARRGLGAAAVFARAVPAGIIASSRGSAIAAPAPFRTVRRDRCFLERNMALVPPDLQGAVGLLIIFAARAVVDAGSSGAGARRRKASLFTTPKTMSSKR